MQQNILLIICDQLSALALRCYGSRCDKTTFINELAREGTRLENAYCTTPLCQPSRASFWSSRYPHETGVTSNLRDLGFPALSSEIKTLGERFSEADYQTWHFGKEHDYGALRGFERFPSEERVIPREDPAINLAYETFLDIDTTEKVCAKLGSAEAKEGPFFLTADLQNPHNICFYVGENTDGCRDFQGDPELPELPDNFRTEDMAERPGFIQYLCCAHRRLRQASHWSEDDYRHYLYAYHHYLSRVDRQIGEILRSLRENGLEDNTLVVFAADHGEGMAAHGLVTKYGNFYEETVRVPFIFKGPDIPAGRTLKGLASLLDLKPTLLAAAGLEQDAEDRGFNLYPSLTDPSSAGSPDAYIVSCWEDEFSGYTVPGRMYRFADYKYIAYRDYLEAESDAVGLCEEFYDLKEDPGEKHTLINDPDYQRLIAYARRALKAHCEKSGDPFFTEDPDYDRKAYRQHQPGYCHHEGLSAVEIHVQNRKKS